VKQGQKEELTFHFAAHFFRNKSKIKVSDTYEILDVFSPCKIYKKLSP
jgi:hypothetical protein